MGKRSGKVGSRRSQYSLFDQIELQHAPRVLLVEFFYWPFLAFGLNDPDLLAVVADKGVVKALSPRAKKEGIVVGDRARTAISVAPDLMVISSDLIDHGKLIFRVSSILEKFSPLLEVFDQGVWAINAKGPSRYFGGEASLAQQIREALAEEIVPDSFTGKCQKTALSNQDSLFSFGVSIADGIFTARVAAKRSLIIPAGESGAFLAPLPVTELPDGEVVELLTRLGIASLGEFADLDFNLVMQRFGTTGALLHRMASGLDTSLLEPVKIKDDFNQKIEFEDPVETASAVAFSCRAAADYMLKRLLEDGYICQSLRVVLLSDNGEESIRDWSIQDGFSSNSLLERVRWQLESWSCDPETAPSAGVKIVQFLPQRVVLAGTNQLGLDGSERTSLAKVSQALSRVDSIVGKGSAFAKLKGSRTARGSVDMVSWQMHLFQVEEADNGQGGDKPPWPGRLLGLIPAICFESEVRVDITAEDGMAVVVRPDASLSGKPYWICILGTGSRFRVEKWSAVWPMMERWWDQSHSTRVARMQIVTEELGAVLVKSNGGKWSIEGAYD